MKKMIGTLLCAGILALSSCAADMKNSGSAKSGLSGAGYSVEVYGYEEAKTRIQNLKYDGFTFKDAIYAEKGSGDSKDLLIAFFFNNIDDASNFMTGDNNNIVLMNGYLEKNLGKNLQGKVGTYNNVAYCGSETSYTAAFGSI